MDGSRGHEDPAGPRPVATAWAQLATDAPDGLAVVDSTGRFVHLNRAGVTLCRRAERELLGAVAPFPLNHGGTAEPLGLFEDGSAEHVTGYSPAPGVHREFAYRLRRLSNDSDLTAVAFRDVTDERHRQRRVAALARTAAKLASQGPVSTTLDALASEVLQTDALAGVQILTRDESGGVLRIMGSAGFAHWPDFFDRLMAVRERGGTLQMLKALEASEPVVVPRRWTALRKDPAWEPLHEYLSELEWDSFASIPLVTRGYAVGVLNAFFAPGQVVGGRTMEFLTAMAEQAAIAVDYAALMQRERDFARREERQRLARDLHDSVVQQVFSISMQAKSMEVLGERGEGVPGESVRRIADEVGVLTHTVLADLRAMVHELRPSSSTELGGLGEAIRALVDSTRNRTGLRFSLALGHALEQLTGELADDIYRIVAEAIHNIVKHAGATTVTIRLGVHGERLEATITDDGRGIGGTPQAIPGPVTGYGLDTMRERAQRWGGTVTVTPGRRTGTLVQLAVPSPRESRPPTDGLPMPDTMPPVPSAPVPAR